MHYAASFGHRPGSTGTAQDQDAKVPRFLEDGVDGSHNGARSRARFGTCEDALGECRKDTQGDKAMRRATGTARCPR
jgi:hypothetical protein